jgi:hypothetical protein
MVAPSIIIAKILTVLHVATPELKHEIFFKETEVR